MKPNPIFQGHKNQSGIQLNSSEILDANGSDGRRTVEIHGSTWDGSGPSHLHKELNYFG